MNMNRSWTPPDNAKILPSMYNILDAHTLKKTSTINSMLSCQLTTQQNVISRNKYQAERVIREEKARTENVLNQIQKKLPAVGRIRDFDMKFFGNADDDLTHKKLKNYQHGKTDDSICRRCYIHHLPLKKKFYQRSPLPTPKNRFLTSLPNAGGDLSSPKQLEDNLKEDNPTSKENSFSETDPGHVFHFKSSETAEVNENGRRTPLSPAKPVFGWWMPQNKTFQFLKKDQCGREMDVNKYYTPRLMPYEDWKHIVSDVCSRYSKDTDGLHTL